MIVTPYVYRASDLEVAMGDTKENDELHPSAALPRQPGALRGQTWTAPDVDDLAEGLIEAMESGEHDTDGPVTPRT